MRYLKARSTNAFISFISAVSMLGIALSVAVLIIVMAVVNGFESELERRILSVVPDGMLYGYGAANSRAPLSDWQGLRSEALKRPDVLAAAPFVEGAGMAQVGDELLQVRVRGVDVELEREITSLSERIVEGSFDGLADDWSIVIGSSLAESLAVGQGDEVRLRVPEFRFTLAGAVNTYRDFTVAGIFDVGMAEFDRGLVLINFDDATKLYRTRGLASGISLKVDNVYDADLILQDFGRPMTSVFNEGYLPESWSYRYQNIFQSITLTKQILFIALSLVMAIAVFNIVSTLVMVVREKRGDIAILRSIGAAPREILSVFVTQGSTIGLIGALGGLVLGLILVASLGPVVGWIEGAFAVDLLSEDVYPIGDLPVEVRAAEIAQICLLALVMSALATIYPALRAARQPPAEALRNE
jgi:lipoprotein-releasing system permease protein